MYRLFAKALGRALATVALWVTASPAAHASFLSGEALDKAADVLTVIVIIIVPIVAIAIFWMVHVLPEKIAHKRNHPQTAAIQVLCLLSLVFGGMLWPLAWLWAYSKPVLYKMAYGTDRLEEHAAEPPAVASGPDFRAQVAHLKGEVERLASAGGAPPELAAIRDQLAALEPRLSDGDGGAR